ncbi:transglycosylase SLT domain-containing protein [Haliea atlantica]|nr:hypothetical protein [Haliea sp.]
MRALWRGLLLAAVLLGTGCATAPPVNVDNLCSIFRDKDDWYAEAADARENWGSPIPVMMAIMYQESRFQAKARPPRGRILWVIPGPRPSDAYGYSQALKSTWAEYEESAGRWSASRSDFGDAIDFIGWYNDRSRHRSGIPSDDAYRLYLAYHEGHGGYNRGTYRDKRWLQSVARRVDDRARRYRGQLASCEEELKRQSRWFGLF